MSSRSMRGQQLHGGQVYTSSLDLRTSLQVEMARTQQLYAGKLARPQLTYTLLRNPNMALIRQVFEELSRQSGCCAEVFGRAELEDASVYMEDKNAFLQKLIHWVQAVLGESSRLYDMELMVPQDIVPVLAADPVLKNILLQDMICAAEVSVAQASAQTPSLPPSPSPRPRSMSPPRSPSPRRGEWVRPPSRQHSNEDVFRGLYESFSNEDGQVAKKAIFSDFRKCLMLASLFCTHKSHVDMLKRVTRAVEDLEAQSRPNESMSFEQLAALPMDLKDSSAVAVKTDPLIITEHNVVDALHGSYFPGVEYNKTGSLHSASRRALAVVQWLCRQGESERRYLHQVMKEAFANHEMTPCEELQLSISALCCRLRHSHAENTRSFDDVMAWGQRGR
eukprot:TRINITY_DN43563_c0_g1_i1.p1 TRINITY_DN43563_c0_g1~~TRINITY_DN43563_c0_g1_i1.p1  ORF type:complete len:417 (+),score=42.33 TRINITY_DN43563_c0_g1_i1:76-1251(+)